MTYFTDRRSYEEWASRTAVLACGRLSVLRVARCLNCGRTTDDCSGPADCAAHLHTDLGAAWALYMLAGRHTFDAVKVRDYDHANGWAQTVEWAARTHAELLGA